MINLYWDLTRFSPSRSAEEWHRLDTWQAEIKNKYDPAFIPNIVAQEGCQLIRCKNCGSEIPSDVAFCPQCGTHLVEPAQSAERDPPKPHAFAVVSMIAGIFSVGASWCPIAGYIFALIALLAYFLGRKKNQGSP